METQLQHLCSKMTFCCCFQLGNSGLERSQPAKFVGGGEGFSGGGVVGLLCKGLVSFFLTSMSHVSTNFHQFPPISTNFSTNFHQFLKFRTCPSLKIKYDQVSSFGFAIIPSSDDFLPLRLTGALATDFCSHPSRWTVGKLRDSEMCGWLVSEKHRKLYGKWDTFRKKIWLNT